MSFIRFLRAVYRLWENRNDPHAPEFVDPSKPLPHGRTLALDFDGLLHGFQSGWLGHDVITDPPVFGMAEACHALQAEGWQLIVLTARARYPGGRKAIMDWLAVNGFPSMPVVSEKIPAEIYADDRGYLFTGDVNHFLDHVRNWAGPWTKRRPSDQVL